MKLKVGQRVRIKRTDSEGVVTRLMEGEVVQVKLDGGGGHMAMPVEALETAPSFTPPVQPVAPAVPAPAKPHHGTGLRLAFDPQLNNEAQPVAYELYLLNGTGVKLLYELKVTTGQHLRWTKSGLLEAGKKKRLDAVEHRWLNEKLCVEADVRAVTVGGTGKAHDKKLNVKPKHFHRHLQDVPELFRDAHLYELFPSIDATEKPPTQQPASKKSLAAITAEHIRTNAGSAPNKPQRVNELQERLHFPEVLDLHLSALVEDPEQVLRHEVLPLQLKRFDAYMDEALRLGMDAVTVIHGVGSGALRRAIHSRLHRMQFIRNFKNEYHPKYGTGATEITFD